jgi:hypothetical protein
MDRLLQGERVRAGKVGMNHPRLLFSSGPFLLVGAYPEHLPEGSEPDNSGEKGDRSQNEKENSDSSGHPGKCTHKAQDNAKDYP